MTSVKEIHKKKDDSDGDYDEFIILTTKINERKYTQDQNERKKEYSAKNLYPL